MFRRLMVPMLLIIFVMAFSTITIAEEAQDNQGREINTAQNVNNVENEKLQISTKPEATLLRSQVVPGDPVVKTNEAVADKVVASRQGFGREVDKSRTTSGDRMLGLLRSSILPGPEVLKEMTRDLNVYRGQGQDINKSSYVVDGRLIGNLRSRQQPGDEIEKTRTSQMTSEQRPGREVDKSNRLRGEVTPNPVKSEGTGSTLNDLDGIPSFWEVVAINTEDSDVNGYYESVDFEIDVDISDETSEEVGFNIYDDQGNDYGWFGPYTFTSDLTSDNVVITGMTSELVDLAVAGDVIFYFDLEHPYGSTTILETFDLTVPIDAAPVATPPEFWSVDYVNEVDADGDGYYETWDFEIDVDVPDGSTQEVYINIVDDEGYDFGDFGPYSFTGTLTSDNAFISGFEGVWFTGIPRDVYFTFNIEWDGGVSDTYETFVPAGEAPPIPGFFQVNAINTVDADVNTYYESFDFEIDVDVPDGGTAEVGFHVYDNFGNDYGWYGPYTFEGTLTTDNVILEGMTAELVGLGTMDVVTFTFDLEFPYNSDIIVDTTDESVPVDAAPIVSIPEFWDIYIHNPVDMDLDGYYENWGFEIDVDVPDEATAEVLVNIVDDEGTDYGNFGPFTFEGTLTTDNAFITGFEGDWFAEIPRDVYFDFDLIFDDEIVDELQVMVPAGTYDGPVPSFWSVITINEIDMNENGFLESLDFVVDVDVTNSGIVDVGIHLIDDQGNDYGWYGPYTYEGTLTTDNVTMSGMTADLVGLEVPADVVFLFELEFPFESGSIVDQYDVTEPIDVPGAVPLPFFWNVYTTNEMDLNQDGFFESWDFGIDVDVPDEGTAEVYVNIVDDEGNDYGFFGPFTFTGSLTTDNVFITGFMGDWFTEIPRDVYFDFYLEYMEVIVDEFTTYVPAGVSVPVPYFFDVSVANPTDFNQNGYYESWDFEIDVDVPEGGIAEVELHFSDMYGNDYGWYGPYTFEGELATDNVILYGMNNVMFEFEVPMIVDFYFDLGFPVDNPEETPENIVDTYTLSVPVDAGAPEDSPYFWSVYLGEGLDFDDDGLFQAWDFEIDVDVPNAGIAEVWINVMDDEDYNYGDFGPFVFEGTLTSDNATIGTFLADWFADLPRDVYFDFSLIHNGNLVDIFTAYISAESAADDGGAANAIGGFVHYYDGFPMPMIHLFAGDFSSTTGPEGGYLMFVDDGSYSVTAMEDEEYPLHWGMNILDVVKTNRHLAVIEEFDDPFKMIAGDVDVDGDVTILDVVNMKEALAMLAPLPSGPMGFFDSLFEITFDNWWVAPMAINVTLPPSAMDIDFTGVCFGDVNASFFDFPTGTDEITGNLQVVSVSASPGEEINVPIWYDGEYTMHGYQLNVNYDSDKLEFIGVNQDGVIANNIDGTIRLVWSDISNGIETENAIVSLRFNVLAEEGESTTISIDDVMIADYDGNLIDVSLENGDVNVMTTGVRFDDSLVITEYKLHTPYPNPFNPTTTISFDVPEISEVSVRVFNTLGQMVGELYNGKVPMGRYELTFNGAGMASGVYYVVMQAADMKQVVPIQLVK